MSPSDPGADAAGAAALAPLETPCYLLDPARVGEDLRALRAALGTPVVTSVKASPVLDLLVRCSHDLADGIELASMGELNLTIGRVAVPRFVNTPALDAPLVAAALACKATLVAENPHQLALIAAAHRKQGKPGAVLGIVLRVNAASLLGRAGPQDDHFGMDLATLRRELDRLGTHDSGLRVIGLHVFAGSNSFAATGAEIARRLGGLVPQLRHYPAAALELAMLGAGLPADWQSRELDFAGYGDALAPLQAQVRVLHEAGRAVFARSGRFVTRVLAVKPLNGGSVVVCDGGMAQCFALAQTEQFVKRWREPLLVPGAERTATSGPRTHKVVGNSCNRADVIGELRTGVEPQPGDWLVFGDCGAYHSYSPSGFLNLRPARRYIAS